MSKEFYDLTARSASCMSKVKVNVGRVSRGESGLDGSKRRYSSLKLHKISDEIFEFLCKHSWTNVSMLIGSITDLQCSKLLRLMSPTIREIELYIDRVLPTTDDSAISQIDFPRLETLTFRWTSKRLFEPFTAPNNVQLKNVFIEINQPECHREVKSFLAQNKTIKNLSIRLSNEDFSDLFAENLEPNVQLKLETLSFYWRNTSFVEQERIENLRRFFLSQRECLTRLVFECTFDCKSLLEQIVNDMAALEHLTLVDLDDVALRGSDKAELTLEANPTIKQIDVCVTWFISDLMFTKLIRATPNLEVLYLVDLSVNAVIFLAKNTKKLRHLVYEEIDSGCEALYTRLIEDDRDRIINKRIKITWDQDFEILYPELHRKMQFH